MLSAIELILLVSATARFSRPRSRCGANRSRMCAGAMHWSQLGRMVFGAFDEKAGYRRIGGRLLHAKTQVTGGVLEAECADLMKAFFRKKRAL